MKLDRWFLAIGTITAVLSCKSSTSGQAAQNIIHMPLKFDALEAWVKSIEIVPLDGDDTHLLGSRVEIDTDGKDWFIADKENGKLFRYSGEGRFLNEIGRRGNGPGEFLKLQDYQFSGDTVVVFSFPDRMYSYSKDGQYYNLTSVPGLGDNSILLGNGILTYRGYRPDNKYRLSYIGESRTEHYLGYGHRVMNMSTGDPVFAAKNERVFVVDSYNSTVYVFSEEEGFLPYVTFDFGKYNIPEDFYRYSDPFKGAQFLLERDFARVSRFIVGDAGWLAEIAVQTKTGVTLCYCYSFQGGIVWFKQSAEDPFFSSFRRFENNCLIAVIGPESSEKVITIFKDRIVNPDAIQSITDNYVIAKIRFD